VEVKINVKKPNKLFEIRLEKMSFGNKEKHEKSIRRRGHGEIRDLLRMWPCRRPA